MLEIKVLKGDKGNIIYEGTKAVRVVAKIDKDEIGAKIGEEVKIKEYEVGSGNKEELYYILDCKYKRDEDKIEFQKLSRAMVDVRIDEIEHLLVGIRE